MRRTLWKTRAKNVTEIIRWYVRKSSNTLAIGERTIRSGIVEGGREEVRSRKGSLQVSECGAN